MSVPRAAGMPVPGAHTHLAAIAAYGLPGDIPALPAVPLTDAAWQGLMGEVVEARLVGLLGAAVMDGAMPVTAGQRKHVAGVHAAAMARVVLLERVMLDAVAALGEAGIDHRLLKGSATARMAYPDPSWRVFGDVDLLVPATAMDAAVDVFAGCPWRRRQPALRPGFDRRFGKSVTLVRDDGVEIDLHRTLAPGSFGLTVDPAPLFAGSAYVVVADRRIPTLGPEAALLAACYHAVLGDMPPRLSAVRDVAQQLLRDPDAAAVRDLAASWRGEAVLAHGLRLAAALLGFAGGTPLESWAERAVPPRAQRRRLAAHTRTGRAYGRTALSALEVLPGLGAKAAYVRGLLAPDPAALRYYASGYASWWWRGARGLWRRS